MAINTGNQAGNREDLSDVYQMIIDRDLGSTLKYFGISGEAKAVKHEWMEGELASFLATLAQDINQQQAGANCDVLVPAADGVKFRAGTVFKIEGVTASGGGFFRVTGITPGNPNYTLACIAGVDGQSTPAASAGATVRIISHPVVEGSLASDVNTTFDVIRTRAYNYTEIFFDKAEVTETQENVDKAGVDSELAEQIEARLAAVKKQMEGALLDGVRSTTGAGVGAQRHMGGILFYLRGGNAVDASGAAISLALINNLMRAIYEDGGEPDTIICPPIQRQKISQLYAGYLHVPHGHGEVGESVDRIRTDFGTLNVLMDMKMNNNMVIICTKSKIRMMPLVNSAVSVRQLPDLGLKKSKYVTGEYTAEVRDGKRAHGYLYNLSVA